MITVMRAMRAAARVGIVPTSVISGTARGADRTGETWAKARGIPVVRMPANWDAHGRSAGYRRNTEMAEAADALVAVWDGESRGTKHIIEIAKARELNVFVHIVDYYIYTGTGAHHG